MPEWAIRLVCSVAGGMIGLVVMACGAMARDADLQAEFERFRDNIKVRVRWKCPECGFEQADYVPVVWSGTRIEYLLETKVTCSGFLGGCGKSFLLGSQITPTVEVIEPSSRRIYPTRGE